VHAEEVAKTQKLLYFVNIGRGQCVLYGLEFVNSGKNAGLVQSEPKVGDFFEFTFGQVNLYPILDETIEQEVKLLVVLVVSGGVLLEVINVDENTWETMHHSP
jgi:hypothetical protein